MLLSQFEHIPSMKEQFARVRELRNVFRLPKPVLKALPKPLEPDPAIVEKQLKEAIQKGWDNVVPPCKPVKRFVGPDGRDWLHIATKQPMAQILDEVCKKHKVTARDIRSRRMFRKYALARFEFCYRARNETEFSYPVIGKFINKDHTSVLHAIRRWEGILEGGEA